MIENWAVLFVTDDKPERYECVAMEATWVLPENTAKDIGALCYLRNQDLEFEPARYRVVDAFGIVVNGTVQSWEEMDD